MVRKEKYSF